MFTDFIDLFMNDERNIYNTLKNSVKNATAVKLKHKYTTYYMYSSEQTTKREFWESGSVET